MTEPEITNTSTETAPLVANEQLEPLTPRVGTIVWGGILLVVAAIAISASLLDLGDVTPALVIWSIVGFGAVLVIAGIVIAIARTAGRQHPPIG